MKEYRSPLEDRPNGSQKPKGAYHKYIESNVKSAVSIQHISTGKEPYEYLCTQLVFEGTQRRSSVIGPVTPGASGQAILSSVIRLGFHV